MTSPNPYAHSRTEGALDVPGTPAPVPGSYAVPDPLASDAPYISAFGWAPSLRLSPDGVPDSARNGVQALRETRPAASLPTDSSYQSLDADKRVRHSVEYQDADGWAETKDFPGYPSPAAGANRFAPNPRSTPPPEPRPTTGMSPSRYVFTRPFMQGLAKMGARHLNGIHFSMADHRRTYDTHGMEPVHSRRNTYRLDPGPWDANLVDMPPANDNAPANQNLVTVAPTVDVPYTSRSWRLS